MSIPQFSWIYAVLAFALFVAASAAVAALMTALLVRLPADYFQDSHDRRWLLGRHPVLRWTALIVKNLIGAVVAILGIVMALPGVPGPGILTILLGILLVDFPGKRRLERWVIGHPRVFRSVNRLRRRYGKPRLSMDRRARRLARLPRSSLGRCSRLTR